MGSKSATTADQVARVVIVVGVLVVVVIAAVAVVAPVGLPLTESDRRNENGIKYKGQVGRGRESDEGLGLLLVLLLLGVTET